MEVPWSVAAGEACQLALETAHQDGRGRYRHANPTPPTANRQPQATPKAIHDPETATTKPFMNKAG